MAANTTTPTAELDAPYSSPDAAPTEWTRAESVLTDAAIYWLSTVRADGRPHATPVIAVWTGGAVHFCTGPDEQKAKNLRANPNVVVTTGSNV
jgi:nitroimidazol reductase NimA-like FMN-containing flavoprotein (pyridoxamine 5'-phosphate oxidase superfamily)